MHKKLTFLVLLIGFSIPSLLGQFCQPPPQCIQNGALDVAPNGTIDNWITSHGSPSTFTGFAGNGVWMWARTAAGVANSEGIYSCFDFQQGHTYQICYKVMNTSGNTVGNLFLRGVSNLLTNTNSVIPAIPAGSDLIDNTFTFSSVWDFRTVTYTPTTNQTGIWIYPFSNANFINGQQYELVIDDIWINEVQPNNITVTATPTNIGYCTSSVLSVNGALPGSTYTWFPSTGLSSTNGASVIAQPCQTTTYTVIIGNPCTDAPCLQPIQRQIEVVVQPNGGIVDNSSVVCGEHIDLEYMLDTPCTVGANIYSWTGPKNGNVLSTSAKLFIPTTIPSDVGIYTLTVTSANGCVNTFTKMVNMNCCDVIADFDVVDCNPIRFVNTTSTTNLSGVQGEWHWDFGDGNTSSIKNPSHLYTDFIGPHTVCLTTVLHNGVSTCCDKICKEIEVCDFGCDPKAAFDYTVFDPNTGDIQLFDKSVGAGTPCSWSWTITDIINGNVLGQSTIKDPAFSLGGPGIYNVCLEVEYCQSNGQSCFETWCEDIIIN